MKTGDTRFCDVCGRELKTPAFIKSKAGDIVGGYTGTMKDEYNAEIRITLQKIAGAYSDFCHDCAQNILNNATILYGEIGGTLKITTEARQ